ncbi:MAG: sulfatase [Deltaproteobacteria bacterium]|nr:sulfatase [Candidatus Zymogenaceae bacterium]
MTEQPRPNLIYIFADQLGRNHLGYAGARNARTPHIDRMAQEGVDFTHAVSTMPVCSAYRASLFTGKYPTTTGMVINELRMNPNHRAIGHVLTDAGYETGYIGKWHLYANQFARHHRAENSFVPPGPHRLGFDGYWAAYNFNHTYWNAYYYTDTPEKLYYTEDPKSRVYEPTGQTDLAVDFIRRAARRDAPFALFLSFGVPHDPWRAKNAPPREFLEPFLDLDFPNPPNYRAKNDPYADLWGRFLPGARRHLLDWRRVYYAMNANLDWNLGRLLSALDDAGRTEDTVVVFTSDHGEMLGAQGRRNKNTFYEEACRVPFIIRRPGSIPAGHTSAACLGTPDIMPTLLSLLDLSIPSEVEGIDLSHCVFGQPGPEPEAALMQNLGACAIFRDGYEWRGARDTRFTYAVYRRDGAEHLYDNIEDPFQTTNLADDPAYSKEKVRLKECMYNKMAELNDTFETSSWYRKHWIEGRNIMRGAKG